MPAGQGIECAEVLVHTLEKDGYSPRFRPGIDRYLFLKDEPLHLREASEIYGPAWIGPPQSFGVEQALKLCNAETADPSEPKRQDWQIVS
jgi:hypothetical protein